MSPKTMMASRTALSAMPRPMPRGLVVVDALGVGLADAAPELGLEVGGADNDGDDEEGVGLIDDVVMVVGDADVLAVPPVLVGAVVAVLEPLVGTALEA